MRSEEKIARELIRLATSILSIEFDNDEQLKEYLKDHPDADKSKHKVKTQDGASKGESTSAPSNEDIAKKLDLEPDLVAEIREAMGAQGVDKLKQSLSSMDEHEVESMSRKAEAFGTETITARLENSEAVKKSVGSFAKEMETNAKSDDSINTAEEAFNSVDEKTRSEARSVVSEEVADGIVDAADKATGGKAPLPWKKMGRAFVKKAVPSALFGFIDNFIMVIAGDMIDANIGQALGVGAMASAGLGNTVSDAIGSMGESSIDKLMDKIGLSEDDVAKTGDKEEDDERTKKYESMAKAAGGVIGITVGCLAGMVPLLFMGGRVASASDDNKDTDWAANELRKIASELSASGL